MRLKDKIAIITGAGSGIGEATAVRFAEEGARLVLNDVDGENLHRVVERVRGMGGQAVGAHADISVEAEAASIADVAVKTFGGIDVLVNNAANFTQMGLEQATMADWQRVYGVNVFGTAMVTKYAVPHMKAKGGSIVMVASMSAFIAQPNFTSYSTSKAAGVMMTRSLALDLAPFKIRVNSVCPGCIVTSASHREVERLGLKFEDWYNDNASKHMLGRLGEPVEAANAILFLASEEASFITAAELMVDGGYVHW
ncbi:MAG: SDR family oxidoreductase [Acidobacteria bacterium]|nr:SDR family oxidoreductase [Acidobacteriota bacterium]